MSGIGATVVGATKAGATVAGSPDPENVPFGRRRTEKKYFIKKSDKMFEK
jgi:hypothetical protein